MNIKYLNFSAGENATFEAVASAASGVTATWLRYTGLEHWSWSVWWRHGFLLRMFTLAFLLFLDLAGGSNPVGQSFTLTNLT